MSRHSENHAARKFRRLCLAIAAAATLAGCGESSAPTAQTDEPGTDTPPEATALPRTVYVSGALKVAAFNRASDGNVQPVSGSPFKHATYLNLGITVAEGIVLTPDGRFVFAFRPFEGVINTFVVQPDGGLSRLPDEVNPPEYVNTGTLSLGGNTFTGAVTPNGRFLYTPSFGLNRIFGYRIAENGAITPIDGSPFMQGFLGGWSAIAVAPDGRHLYLLGLGVILSFSIGEDGKLTPVPGSPFPAQQIFSVDLQITPDGKYLYANDYVVSQITGYSLDSEGKVTPLPQGAVPTGGLTPQGMAISPDSRHLFAANIAGLNIAAFNIGDDGSITHAPGSPFPASDLGPTGVQVSPDGKNLYVSHQLLYPLPMKLGIYDIRDDGSLSEVPNSPVDTGVIFTDFQPVAISPNQGPTARLKMSRGSGGITFDASASTDPDGYVATYEWDFGDGQIQTGGAKMTHGFPRSGTYNVAVRAVDDEGCSDQFIYTGRIALCNAAPRGRATLQVRVGG